MNTRKIGLINIQHCDSHGAVLLAFAMEKVISEMGYIPVNLDYSFAGRIIENNTLIKILKILNDWLKKKVRAERFNHRVAGKSVYISYILQHRNFKSFRKKYLNLSSKINNPTSRTLYGYDAYIVGSDVVWKPEIVRCKDKDVFFLKFANKSTRKIAYSASVGTDDYTFLSKYSNDYKDAFDNFDYLSIREQSMIGFVKQYTNKTVISVIDPVFLIDKSVFSAVEKNNHDEFSKNSYLYLYILGENKKAIAETQIFAESIGCQVLVDLNCDFDNSAQLSLTSESAISDGPDGFIYNIRNAKYIITDSFHATAFALIYNIPFCVFGRSNLSVRMNDLLSRFGLVDRKYDGKIPNGPIDWEKVNKQIERERETGINYLIEALKDV